MNSSTAVPRRRPPRFSLGGRVLRVSPVTTDARLSPIAPLTRNVANSPIDARCAYSKSLSLSLNRFFNSSHLILIYFLRFFFRGSHLLPSHTTHEPTTHNSKRAHSASGRKDDMCGAARRKHERRKVWAASGARRREKPGVVWRGQRAGHTRAAVLRSQREAAKAESAKHVCASRTCTQAQVNRLSRVGWVRPAATASWLPGPHGPARGGLSRAARVRAAATAAGWSDLHQS